MQQHASADRTDLPCSFGSQPSAAPAALPPPPVARPPPARPRQASRSTTRPPLTRWAWTASAWRASRSSPTCSRWAGGKGGGAGGPAAHAQPAPAYRSVHYPASPTWCFLLCQPCPLQPPPLRCPALFCCWRSRPADLAARLLPRGSAPRERGLRRGVRGEAGEGAPGRSGRCVCAVTRHSPAVAAAWRSGHPTAQAWAHRRCARAQQASQVLS